MVERACEDPSEQTVERSLTAGIEVDLKSCLGSEIAVALVIVLLPALLLYLYQAMVLPRAFYTIALFEKAQKSLSGTNRTCACFQEMADASFPCHILCHSIHIHCCHTI
jgi:hypothetical protein